MIETLVVVFPLMVSPGPANLVSLLLATRYGFVSLLPFQFGIVTFYAIMAVGMGMLAEQLGEASPTAITFLQLVGGVFIVFLGVRMTRASGESTTERTPSFFSGVVLQCLNPKFPGVLLTVFAVRYREPTMLTAAVICCVGVVGLLSYSAAGCLLGRGGSDSRQELAVSRIAGVSLCAVGLWIVWQGLLRT